MIDIILQCDLDRWMAGEFVEGVSCVFTDAAGEFFMALLVFVGLAIGSAIYTESLVVPSVLTLLVGGLAIRSIPGPAAQVAVIMLVLVVGTLLFVGIRWYQR